jgi:membrane-associated protein
MQSISQLWDVYVRHLDERLREGADWLGPWFYVILFVIIFAETGLVVTPFLPGDSLLFAVGALAAVHPAINLGLVFVLLVAAAVLGDAVNYHLGRWLGPKVFRSERSWFFNKNYLLRAQQFYEKYGSKTIILARFVPIVRTFAPFVAGIGEMKYPRFFLYNVVGGVAWVAICLFAGVFFGQIGWIKEHFEYVVLGIIVVSLLPMAVEFFVARHKVKEPAKPAPAEAAPLRQEKVA